MKSIFVCFIWGLLMFFYTFSFGQIIPKDPDEFLVKSETVPKVLLVGSFHFAYYGLDAHKTSEKNKVNILSETRQKEMEELVDYIALFKPTKLLVENDENTTLLMERYHQYNKNKGILIANEIDQICFRLMDKFKIDTLYGVNAWGLSSDLYQHPDTLTFYPFLDNLFKDWDYRSDDTISKRYTEWYDYQDKLASEITLLEYFKYLNSEKSINRTYGAYLAGDFKLDKYRGADAMTINWYSRNIRIFRNIQNIDFQPNDRILVLFGAGHIGILDHLFKASPEFELISFDELEE